MKEPNLFGEDGPSPAAQALTTRTVTVREVACKSLLNRGGISDYSFNCYTGCEHGCLYCYARFMQRFHPHAEPWGNFVDVKVNAAAVLARQLRRLPPGSVFTCSACDGWQRVEQHYRLTRRCCELLLDAGFHLGILTKNARVLRDLDLLAGRDVRLGVTITTANEQQARLWEPEASCVGERIRVLKEAKAAGLETSVMFGPLLPEISDTADALDRLFALAAEAEVDHIWTDALNPRPRVWPSVRSFLQRRRPDLLPLYKQLLFDKRQRSEYVDRLEKRIRRAAARSGLTDRLS